MNETLTKPKKDKLDEAIINYKKIKLYKCPKFNDLDNFLLKQSKTFLKETTYTPPRYMTYKKGTIVKVDFGINYGSEICNPHFAIVMNNNDNCKTETINVIPLTSKNGANRIELSTLIFDEFIKQIDKKINNASSMQDINELRDLIKEYKKYIKLSYANISQFRCISKNRIMYPKNKYDMVGKARCSKKVMCELEQALIENFIQYK